MDNTTTEAPMRITLSDLHLLQPNMHYRVEKSISTEFDTNIYEVLEIPDGKIAYVRKTQTYEGGSWYGRGQIIYKYELEIQDDYRQDWQRNNSKPLILFVPRTTKPKPDYSGDYYRKGVTLGDLHLNVNNNHYSQRESKIFQGEDGLFYVRMFGVDFDIYKFESSRYSYGDRAKNSIQNLLYNWKSIESSYGLKKSFKARDLLNAFLKSKGVDRPTDLDINRKKDGVAKTLDVVTPYYQELLKTDFFAAACFKLFFEESKRTLRSIKISTIANKMFSNVQSQAEFNEKVESIAQAFLNAQYIHGMDNILQEVIDSQPDAREVKKAALKRKATGAFSRIMDDLDFVDIDAEKFPLTHEAVHGGTIPIGTFFRKSGDSYFVYNDNWSLWEEMLTQYPDIAREIAEQAAKRTTYEKDIMSYFQFVLHTLPEYLGKHAGGNWKGIPKLVTSANELEPPKEGASGTAKTRSALTPIVDNEKKEVVVPYVSMRVSGYQTTYCYALDFNVLTRGYSFRGNVITEETEKLNGRDQYGLMFYTLTGSAQAQGYPTFLIIFENVATGIRVHFHRTHPMRSKGGDYNPIHSWIKGCYKWMIGNVNYERIKAQQGDLAFVQIEELPNSGLATVATVDSYDNHRFATPVHFVPYTKKEASNVLGYVQVDQDTELIHNEHLNRTVPAGTYEIRQCRSWEANPKGIWSLRID